MHTNEYFCIQCILKPSALGAAAVFHAPSGPFYILGTVRTSVRSANILGKAAIRVINCAAKKHQAAFNASRATCADQRHDQASRLPRCRDYQLSLRLQAHKTCSSTQPRYPCSNARLLCAKRHKQPAGWDAVSGVIRLSPAASRYRPSIHNRKLRLVRHVRAALLAVASLRPSHAESRISATGRGPAVSFCIPLSYLVTVG
jgi:hypothetical protein